MKAKSLVTELLVDDMQKMLEFYTKELNFTLVNTDPNTAEFFAIIANGPVSLMLYRRKEFVEEIPHFADLKAGGTIALFLEVEDVSALYKQFDNYPCVVQPLHTTAYGTTEFSIKDPEGYVIMFNQHAN